MAACPVAAAWVEWAAWAGWTTKPSNYSLTTNSTTQPGSARSPAVLFSAEYERAELDYCYYIMYNRSIPAAFKGSVVG